jgi:glycine/D-amino acid oxidase-like deaminating enzyme
MDGHPIWVTEERAAYPKLRGRQQAEAVVVGGGLCGVTTAYLMQLGGLNVMLLEADRLGHGASGHTMAKVTAQHGLIYSRLKKQWGREVAQAYAVCQTGALSAMAGLVEDMHISCGWTWQDASLCALTSEEELLLEREEEAAQEAGLAVSLKSGGDCPVPVRKLLTVQAQAMFDPYAYVCALADAFTALGGRIHEDSRVWAINTQSVSTETGSVHAPFVVIATHFPIINFPGWYFLRARQQRSHVAALEGAPYFQGMYLHIAEGGFSLRMQGGLTLLSAFDYTCGTHTDTDHEELLRRKASAFFPDAHPIAAWHGQDLMSADGLPFIGPYSRRTPNHFVAAGFSKWGMTNSMAAAQAISARILGEPLPESEIFDPARSIKNSVFPVLNTFASTTASYFSGLPRKSAPRCPHMGCKLKYVDATASWDCPCHGSRFDSIGRIKSGPAVRPALIRNKNRSS